MNPRKQKALEAAGWKFGDAADFLEMTDDERQMIDLRVQAALAVKRQREAMNLSQKELARRIKTSQPRIVKIEKAASDVTLDQMLRAYAAAGGQVVITEVRRGQRRRNLGVAEKGRPRMKRKKSPMVSIELIEGD